MKIQHISFIILIFCVLAFGSDASAKDRYDRPESYVECNSGYKFAIFRTATTFKSHQIVDDKGNGVKCVDAITAATNAQREAIKKANQQVALAKIFAEVSRIMRVRILKAEKAAQAILTEK